MNILFVSQNYHPFVGGIETHVRQVAHELAKKHTVKVAAVNFQPTQLPVRLQVLSGDLLAPSFHSYQDGEVAVTALTPTWLDRVRLFPIAVRALPVLQRYAYQSLKQFGYFWYKFILVPKLESLMQDVDVVHCLGGEYLGWAAQAAAHKRGIPFVATPFVHPRQWGDDQPNIEYYQRCEAVIALLESDRQNLLDIGVPAEKIHVIGVSPDLPASTNPQSFRQQHGLEDVPVVLYIGRMMPQKGAKALLEAAPLVWEQVPNTHFVFIGPALPGSEKWFEKQDARVHHLGRVDMQTKAAALAGCDIFCMPSISEILPTVYLEAWSYGKPVVGGLAHGLPELVEGNGAGLASSQKPVELAGNLTMLLREPQQSQKMGLLGKQLVEQSYSVAAVTEALEILYTEQITPDNRTILVGSLVG